MYLFLGSAAASEAARAAFLAGLVEEGSLGEGSGLSRACIHSCSMSEGFPSASKWMSSYQFVHIPAPTLAVFGGVC